MKQEYQQQLQSFLNIKDYSAAKNYLESIADKVLVDDLDYLYHLAYVSRKLGDLEQAEAYCKKALKKDKNSCNINFELGLIYQLKDKHRKSIESFQKSLKNIPKNTSVIHKIDILNSLALTHKKAGDFGGGLKYYNLALENLAQEIYKNIKRQPIESIDFTHAYSSEDKGWVRLAFQIAVKNTAKEGIKNILAPDGETAVKLLQQNSLVGIAMYDKDDSRYLLPAYFSAFFNTLKSDILYSNIVNNIGTLFAERGEIEEARKSYIESIEFIPQGVKYEDPFIGLMSLENN